MTAMEQYYYQILLHWYVHVPRAPTLVEIGDVCRQDRSRKTPVGQPKPPRWPSHTAVRSAMLGLEGKGYVARNSEGRFEVCK
jgi:hypothetical protein